MNEIFNEIINEANKANIIIDGDSFPIGFNVIEYHEGKEVFNNVENENFPTLIIKDRMKFINQLSDYINMVLTKINKYPIFINDISRNRIKLIITYLFVNATTEDFINPLELIERNMSFINDDTFDILNTPIKVPLLNHLGGSTLEITQTNQSIFMETFKRIDFSLTKEINSIITKYILPSITYGIRMNSQGEKECYIYSILHPKVKIKDNEEQRKYYKKIVRELYKLNAGVLETEGDEYKAYLKGENSYYPENISDVTPSALLSLSIFMSLLENNQIKRIKAVTYLPIRYLSRDITAKQIKDENQSLLAHKRNNDLQQNITDKFIRTFRRLAFHLNGIEIDSYPYEINEYLQMSYEQISHNINNPLLNEVYNSSFNQLQNQISNQI